MSPELERIINWQDEEFDVSNDIHAYMDSKNIINRWDCNDVSLELHNLMFDGKKIEDGSALHSFITGVVAAASDSSIKTAAKLLNLDYELLSSAIEFPEHTTKEELLAELAKNYK